MDREELTALRDAIDVLLKCPDAVRDLLAQWLAPAAAKPNGRDPHPHAPMPPSRTVKVQAARRAKPTPARAAEQRLLAAMRDNPGLSVVALANAAGSSRSETGERLRQLTTRGVVEKDMTGRWKLREEAHPSAQGEEPHPTIASPS